MNEIFNKIAQKVSSAVGSSWAFALAAAAVIVWILTGHYFKYSDSWQLVINTGTTIITFLIVFLIQATQNKDSKAIHLKLNELIRSIDEARNELVDLEDLSVSELADLKEEFKLIKNRKITVQELLAPEEPQIH